MRPPMKLSEVELIAVKEGLSRHLSSLMWDIKNASENATKNGYEHFDVEMETILLVVEAAKVVRARMVEVYKKGKL